MFKNHMTKKLFAYFAVTLLVFSMLIGIVFIFLFNDYTVKVNRNNMLKTANSIAESVSPYLEEGRGGMGYGSILRAIEYVAGGNVWIIDENLNIITNGYHGKGAGKGYTYRQLPANAENVVEQVFHDNAVYSEEFSGLLSQSTLTLGVPIKNGSGNVIGVVLLHSPIEGINNTVAQGITLLGISLASALLVSFFLSVWLSKHFTSPILIKEAEDAIRLDKIRRDFVANVTHELKTPITVIRGSTEALKDGVVTDAVKISEYYDQIIKESTYLQSMVGDLLDLSKLQNPDFPIDKNSIDITDVLEDAIRSVRGIADSKGIQINAEFFKRGIHIVGDYGRLRQLLLILLDNAVKFSPADKAVDVYCGENVIQIRDYGVGIPEDELPYIFDRFHKSRSEENKEGTGLGLTIAKQIADRHNMSLCVTSKVGQGTEFSIYF
jgi:signal transduction histidine kinase